MWGWVLPLAAAYRAADGSVPTGPPVRKCTAEPWVYKPGLSFPATIVPPSKRQELGENLQSIYGKFN